MRFTLLLPRTAQRNARQRKQANTTKQQVRAYAYRAAHTHRRALTPRRRRQRTARKHVNV